MVSIGLVVTLRKWLLILGVIITVIRQEQVCQEPSPIRIKQPDGRYIPDNTWMTQTVNRCYWTPVDEQEEWTDLPENGGKYIRPYGPYTITY